MPRKILTQAACVAGCMLLAPLVLAQTVSEPSAPPNMGQATRQLLQMQREAQGPARPIPGEVMGLSYQRYLGSFKHPIPETLGSSVGPSANSRTR